LVGPVLIARLPILTEAICRVLSVIAGAILIAGPSLTLLLLLLLRGRWTRRLSGLTVGPLDITRCLLLLLIAAADLHTRLRLLHRLARSLHRRRGAVLTTTILPAATLALTTAPGATSAAAMAAFTGLRQHWRGHAEQGRRHQSYLDQLLRLHPVLTPAT
jgi:hypothetical protein